MTEHANVRYKLNTQRTDTRKPYRDGTLTLGHEAHLL